MYYITNADNKQAARDWKDLGIQRFDEYHHLYVESDALLLAESASRYMDVILLVCLNKIEVELLNC